MNAKELARWEPYEPSIQEMRQKLGGPGVSDEELLLRWLLTRDEIAAMRAGGCRTTPIFRLIGCRASRF